MNRRNIPTLLRAIVYFGLALGLAACSTETAKSGWQRALAVVAKPSETASQPAAQAVAIASDGQCRAVEPAEPGACYSPTYAGGALCQPQSIPYARCRTGSTSCQLGNTSPVQWFLCEQRRGFTSATPRPGSLMAVGIHRGHHITTGHTLYVEEVCPNPDGSYKLRVSHTNYDRRCHLEESALVQYDPDTMEADFLTGNWAPWGEDLPVQGFILQEPAPMQESRRAADKPRLPESRRAADKLRLPESRRAADKPRLPESRRAADKLRLPESRRQAQGAAVKDAGSVEKAPRKAKKAAVAAKPAKKKKR